ncbi:50S ribosomal protein L1 [Patescibacteria group bacterium]|nr:50S ribosomal protein L1 [Patescibacteria group bacterium]
MPKHSTRFSDLKQSVDKTTVFPANEAIETIKNLKSAKFDETVEVHFRLGINPKKGDQQVRGTVVLPISFGETKKIAAFVPENKEKEAKEAGADIVYTESTIGALQKSGKIDFDIAIAVPEIMKLLAPLARFLGPKGLMPSPKNETITTNLKKTIEELKKGKVAFKNDDTANVHLSIGKKSMATEQLMKNYESVFDALTKAKPEGSKGVYIKNITICSTMSPGIKVAVK